MWSRMLVVCKLFLPYKADQFVVLTRVWRCEMFRSGMRLSVVEMNSIILLLNITRLQAGPLIL